MRDYYAIRFSSTLKSSPGHSITQNAAYLGSRDHSVASDGVIGRAPARGPRTVGCSDFQGTDDMKIHVGFDMAFECPQPTPMIFMVNVHPSRAADLITLDSLRATPARLTTTYIDGFGNKCTRLLAPAGELRVTSDAIRRGQRPSGLRRSRRSRACYRRLAARHLGVLVGQPLLRN